MDFYESEDDLGRVAKYCAYIRKPEVGDLIQVIFPSELNQRNDTNTFNNLSINRVYEVHRVVNVHQIIVRDDIKELAHLTKVHFRLMREITEEELKEYMEEKKLVMAINELFKFKAKKALN
ncbi:hypothetical protein ABZ756_00535 [Mammaliicoccus sciuri]